MLQVLLLTAHRRGGLAQTALDLLQLLRKLGLLHLKSLLLAVAISHLGVLCLHFILETHLLKLERQPLLLARAAWNLVRQLSKILLERRLAAKLVVVLLECASSELILQEGLLPHLKLANASLEHAMGAQSQPSELRGSSSWNLRLMPCSLVAVGVHLLDELRQLVLEIVGLLLVLLLRMEMGLLELLKVMLVVLDLAAGLANRAHQIEDVVRVAGFVL